MKNLNSFIIILALSSFVVDAFSQPCEKDISTNPDNPFNEPMEMAYPNLINPWLNTFDISDVQSIAPPAAETGIALGETERILTEKVEELTLYIIAINKEVKRLQSALEDINR